MKPLPSDLLAAYAHGFYGYGTWAAPVWFIGMEEGGGQTCEEVAARLAAWDIRGRRELEDLPGFHAAYGEARWHGKGARSQRTWRQLIRMLLLGRGEPDLGGAILEHQRTDFGRMTGKTCVSELLPLPSPSIGAWHYADWSDLEWLKTREAYQNFMLLERACRLRDRVEEHRPPVVVFYGSSWHRYWGMIARGGWSQAIQGRLMGLQRNGTAFYVTRHPARESDAYFREIGEFLRRRHGASL